MQEEQLNLELSLIGNPNSLSRVATILFKIYFKMTNSQIHTKKATPKVNPHNQAKLRVEFRIDILFSLPLLFTKDLLNSPKISMIKSSFRKPNQIMNQKSRL